MASREEMSTSFGAAADTYEAGRPEYPLEAVQWMLQPVAGAGGGIRAVDVGAGTGKLTRALVALEVETVAVDPDPAMLATLRERVRGVPTFVGAAEHLPIPDASVDAVVLGQAWHWVEPVAGSAETARVLRSGGVLGLIWNIRDESVPWVRRLTRIMHGSHAEEMLAAGAPPLAAPFERVEHAEWRWERPMTRAALHAMAASRSYIITAAPRDRAEIGARLDDLFDEIGAVDETAVTLPYVTRAYRALRPSSPGGARRPAHVD